ncbi:hypothetical protein SXCC_01830 [Gluconacetobacter sp. SXCC-1]|nr:hypothetical protein SXCC_01830 [Gluconacetobacter sp. SXCC-1]
MWPIPSVAAQFAAVMVNLPQGQNHLAMSYQDDAITLKVL